MSNKITNAGLVAEIQELLDAARSNLQSYMHDKHAFQVGQKMVDRLEEVMARAKKVDVDELRYEYQEYRRDADYSSGDPVSFVEYVVDKLTYE